MIPPELPRHYTLRKGFPMASPNCFTDAIDWEGIDRLMERNRRYLEARAAAAALADSADRLFSAPGIVREDSAPLPTFDDWAPTLEALRNGIPDWCAAVSEWFDVEFSLDCVNG